MRSIKIFTLPSDRLLDSFPRWFSCKSTIIYSKLNRELKFDILKIFCLKTITKWIILFQQLTLKFRKNRYISFFCVFMTKNKKIVVIELLVNCLHLLFYSFTFPIRSTKKVLYECIEAIMFTHKRELI